MNSSHFFIIFYIFLVFCNPTILFADDSVIVNKNIYYSKLSLSNNLDIYKQSNASKRPVIVMVHGGGWKHGDKSNTNVVENKVKHFVEKKGYIFVSVNYRTEQNNIHPQEVNDVADAILWIYKNIDKYGGDKNKIALIGHSAGAHLVSLIATNKQYLQQREINFSIIKGVVELDTGGLDLYYLLRDNELEAQFSIKDKMFFKIVKKPYEVWLQYSDEEIKKASPINYIDNTNNIPPFLLIQSLKNKAHIIIADKFQEKLHKNGFIVFREDFHLSHSEINSNIGLEKTKLTEIVDMFLENIFF